MSGIVKAAKKVWKKTTGKVLSTVNKIHKKLRQSKIYKVAVAAAAVYFGGAALMGMMSSGGTAAGGISSAWAGLKGATSAGSFSGAMTSLKSGFMGTAGAAASAAPSTLGAIGGTAPTSAALKTTLETGLLEGIGSAGLQGGSLTAGAGATSGLNAAATTAASSGGWLSGLGEAGKTALITGGINAAGQMMQGHAEQKASEEERKHRTYWGVDGAGNTAGNQVDLGNLNHANPYPQQPNGQQWQPKTLDQLIEETRNRTQANSGLLWG